MSEPEPVSQGEGGEEEMEGGDEPEQVSEPLDTAVDDGSTEQVGHTGILSLLLSNIDAVCVFRVRNWR